jgi:plasmid maintenance system antidote protein VapI
LNARLFVIFCISTPRRRRGIAAETAMRLGRYFSTTSQFWMNLKTRCDLDRAADESRGEIERSIRPGNAA